MRILYLHGLESSNVGKKVDFLKSQAEVLAPSIDYRDPTLEEKLMYMAEIFKPDFIIGSSMGGYVASLLANHIGVNYIAFNPALHSRSFDPILPTLSDISITENITGLFVLGSEDHIINPNITIDMVKDADAIEIEMVEGMGHRIPLNVLVDIYKKYLPTND